MGKGLLYACVAERNIQSDGNFVVAGDNPANSQVTDTVKMILPRIQFDSHKRTLTQSVYHFHYKVSGQYCYLCVTDTDFPIRITYNFLDDIEVQYLRTKTTKVRTLLKDRMAYFNNTKNDKITNLQGKIDDVKDTMIDNIEKILDRGESLDSLIQRTDDLKDASNEFKKGANKVKWGMRKRLAVMIIIIIVLILLAGLLAFVVTWGFCGVDFQKCNPFPTSAPAPIPTTTTVAPTTATPTSP
jgi:vesicle-associated membrane protein 7